MYISKKVLIFTGIVLFVILSITIYFAFSKISLLNVIRNKNTGKNDEKVTVELIKKDDKTNDSIIDEKITESKGRSNESTNSTSSVKDKKVDILTYFNNLDNTIFKEENIKKFGSKAKETFIKITDFVFYGTTLNGVTFNGLKDDIKLKIMNIVLKIDSKIEKIYPGYKTEIKLKITNLKEKIAIKYLEVSSKICESVGEDSCNEAKKGFQNMKESFGFTFDILKELGKEGLSSLKGWYEVFRES